MRHDCCSSDASSGADEENFDSDASLDANEEIFDVERLFDGVLHFDMLMMILMNLNLKR